MDKICYIPGVVGVVVGRGVVGDAKRKNKHKDTCTGFVCYHLAC